jgi:hypothetical protein
VLTQARQAAGRNVAGIGKTAGCVVYGSREIRMLKQLRSAIGSELGSS